MENGQTKAEMFDQFQTWALRNYGDSGKTKTVTKRKHDRIMRFLNGEEAPTTENAKFRFWVKAKGFKLGPGEGDESMKDVLYVPVKTTSHSEDSIIIEKGYKRVAVVEDFFDIIYNVHVEMDARGGKHAGQKRTYKAIAENYAFLPREAVTRFLMSCNECQKRMHLSPIATNENNHILEEVPVIDYSLPITTTYHIQQQKRKLSATYEDNESLTSGDTEASGPSLNSSGDLAADSPQPMDFKNGDDVPMNTSRSSSPAKGKEGTSGMIPLDMTNQSNGETFERPHSGSGRELRSSSAEAKSEETRNYEASTNGHLTYVGGAQQSEAAEDLTMGRDDDDDDGDDDSDKLADTPPQGVDPERLKAFNMFVRLFVDENLDRMVPISKQPKDKIQAIIDACYRQFPELHERARKRIRTYLKSCRRMKRNRDANGLDIRPTPPHLTSAAAEGILAAACQSESENAKRMRLELEQQQQQQQQQQAEILVTQNHYTHDLLRQERRPTEYKFTNGSSFDAFHTGMPPPATTPHHAGIIQHAQPLTNGPTDLSMKKSSNTSKPQLNASEVQTIKQLIAGYRESAAFLLRSADELEQLLLQSN
ncbi:nucleolar protein 4-like [Glandiceps talaboti]